MANPPIDTAKLLIFDTHPIQYRSPVFRSLYEKFPHMKVYFFNKDFDGAKWWFNEVGKAKAHDWGLDLVSGYPNEVLATSKMGFIGLLANLTKLLQKEKPSAILIYGYYLREHWVLRLCCRFLHIPLIFVGESFNSQSKGLRRRLKEPVVNYFFKGVERFIAIGIKTFKYYRSKKIAASRIIPAKYCVSTDFFNLPKERSTTTRNEIRKQFNIPAEAFVLLFVGRLFERKRPEDVLKLHESLLKLEKLHTVLIGTGPMEMALKKSGSGLPRLHLIGFQNQTEVRNWYFTSDLLIVPSEFETWGLVVNEAFACGIPALVTETCGVAEDLVVPNETGFVYPVGDIAKASRFVQLLLENDSLKVKMGESAKVKLNKEYRPDQFADAILLAFNERKSLTCTP